MKKTIRVTGKGQLRVKPDRMRLILTLEDINKEYDKVLQASAEKIGELRSLIERLGFEKEDMKTTYFNVSTEYESCTDKNGNWKRYFKGYKSVHNLKLEFARDNELLGKLLYAIGHSTGKPEIQIEYTVSDPEAAKKELIARAVADSRAKAKVIAEAAGISLGEIASIDYSWQDMEMVARPVERMAVMKSAADNAGGSYNLDIEADDISVSDTVTVVWGIGK